MQSKIEGKFYPLQHEEWLKACRELTPAELKCLYYIRTSDPYSNGVRLTAAAIARDLSCEGQPPVSRQTVSRAIKRLDQLGYIDMEPLEFNVKVSGKGVLVCQHTDGVSAHHDRSSDTNGVSAHHDRSSDTADDRYTPPAIATHQPEPETLTENKFQNSKTSLDSSKNFKDVSKTLSESAGERNLDFWKKLDPKGQAEIRRYAYAFAIPKLPTKPTLPDSWISRHCIELFNQLMTNVDFQKAEASRNSPKVEN